MSLTIGVQSSNITPNTTATSKNEDTFDLNKNGQISQAIEKKIK